MLFDTPVDVGQLNSVDSPGSGRNKLYPKSDNGFYILDSASGERKLVASVVAGTDYNSNIRAGFNLTGGGSITIASNRLKWTTRFIVISHGKGTSFAQDGFFDVSMPAVGTVITNASGTTVDTVTSNGIMLLPWQALYYILPTGGASTSVASNFRIVSYDDADYKVPDHWVLLAIRNLETGSYRLGTGMFMLDGQTITAANPFPQYESTFSSGTTSQYYRGDKTWQMLQFSAIAGNLDDGQLPGRLRAKGQGGVSSGDFNNDVEFGSYLKSSTAPNNPGVGSWGMLYVESPDANYIIQTFSALYGTSTDEVRFRRHYYYDTGWGAWYRLRESQAEQANLWVGLTGNQTVGGAKTFTGETTFNSGAVILEGASSDPWLYFVRTASNDGGIRYNSVTSQFEIMTGDQTAYRDIKAKKVVAGTGVGFRNADYVGGAANPIWSFDTAPTAGMSYYQGAAGFAGADTIGFHFGAIGTPPFQVVSNGDVRAAALYDTGSRVYSPNNPQPWSALSGPIPEANLPMRLRGDASDHVVTDCNLAVDSGFYYYNDTYNGPPGMSDCHLYVTAYNDLYVSQIAAPLHFDRIWFRRRDNGTWTTWFELMPSWNTFNKSETDARYARLSGFGSQTIDGYTQFRNDNATAGSMVAEFFNDLGPPAIRFHNGGDYWGLIQLQYDAFHLRQGDDAGWRDLSAGALTSNAGGVWDTGNRVWSNSNVPSINTLNNVIDSAHLPYQWKITAKTSNFDLNTADEAILNGFWVAAPGSYNTPEGAGASGDWWYGWTITHDPQSGNRWCTQFAQRMTGPSEDQSKLYFRRSTTTWGGWHQYGLSMAESDARYGRLGVPNTWTDTNFFAGNTVIGSSGSYNTINGRTEFRKDDATNAWGHEAVYITNDLGHPALAFHIPGVEAHALRFNRTDHRFEFAHQDGVSYKSAVAQDMIANNAVYESLGGVRVWSSNYTAAADARYASASHAHDFSALTGSLAETQIPAMLRGKMGISTADNYAITSGSYDSLKTPGTYAVTSAVSGGPVATECILKVNAWDGNWVTQEAWVIYGSSGGPTSHYLRQFNNGTWSAWKRLMDETGGAFSGGISSTGNITAYGSLDSANLTMEQGTRVWSSNYTTAADARYAQRAFYLSDLNVPGNYEGAFYTGASTTNQPSGCTYGSGWISNRSGALGNGAYMTICDITTGRTWSRAYTSIAWSAWVEILNQTAADARYSLLGHTHSGVYEPVLSAGTTSQYYRGDKTWQTLNKAAVSLGNVPNIDMTNVSNAASGTLPAAQHSSLAAISASVASSSNITASGQKIINLADGVNSTDVVNKGQLDATVAAMTSVGQELGYAERTTAFTTTNTTNWSTAAGNVISSFSVTVTGTGRPVEIEFYTPQIFHSVAGTLVACYLIVNGGTNNSTSQLMIQGSPINTAGPSMSMTRRLVLTNGNSYTFTVGMAGLAAGTSGIVPSTSAPAHLAVTQR